MLGFIVFIIDIDAQQLEAHAAYFASSSLSEGIAERHAPHQLAQKLIITTSPRNSDSRKFCPSSERSTNSGATLPFSALADPPKATATNKATQTAKKPTLYRASRR